MLLSNPTPSAELIPAPNVDRPHVFRERLLTVRQVAAELRVSNAVVYAQVARGELPCVRVSNAIRIRPADLTEYIVRQRKLTFADGPLGAKEI